MQRTSAGPELMLVLDFYAAEVFHVI